MRECPFCGVSNAEPTMDSAQGRKWGRVVCLSCGATGGEVRTGYDSSSDAEWRREAIAAWNRRLSSGPTAPISTDTKGTTK